VEHGLIIINKRFKFPSALLTLKYLEVITDCCILHLKSVQSQMRDHNQTQKRDRLQENHNQLPNFLSLFCKESFNVQDTSNNFPFDFIDVI
jgi:hypothetical protein